MSKRRGAGGERRGLGKGDQYCTTCLVALTDRLVCAAVSAGQRQPASEREKEKRQNSPKQKIQVEYTTTWLRQTGRRQKRDTGSWILIMAALSSW